MRILRTVKELREWRKLQPTLGFVPTMGALHNGHLNLVGRSLNENHSTLMSIFVNPSQFAPGEDLDSYPRSFDTDVQKFAQKSVDILGKSSSESERTAVFAPKTSELYPLGIELNPKKQRGTFVEVLGCSHQLEGAVRPQFFRGVATVVTKLLNAVQPTKAYFGQKDIQQTVVVRSLVRDLLIPTEIVVCETEREPSGLALSSRNAYLTDAEREKSVVLYKALSAARDLSKNTDNSAAIIGVARDHLVGSDIVDNVEYVSINSLDTFETLERAQGAAVLSAAIRLKSGLRLLDNVLL